jgi:hypothetical protein
LRKDHTSKNARTGLIFSAFRGRDIGRFFYIKIGR